MTRETKRSTRNSKRSARKNATVKKTVLEEKQEDMEIDNYDSLNTSEPSISNEEEKIGDDIEISLPDPSMDSPQQPETYQNKEEMVKIEEVSTVVVEKEDGVAETPQPPVIDQVIEEEMVPKIRETKAPEPKSSVFPSRRNSDQVPRHVVATPKLMVAKEPSFFQGPMIRYGSIFLGILVFYFLFLRKGSGKKNEKGSTAPAGPTIVDVTEVKEGSSSGGSDEKKSVKSSVNRVSSPRIVFGDLRKNPSLMVAPPMTPAVGSRG